MGQTGRAALHSQLAGQPCTVTSPSFFSFWIRLAASHTSRVTVPAAHSCQPRPSIRRIDRRVSLALPTGTLGSFFCFLFDFGSLAS